MTGPLGLPKEEFLRRLKEQVPADEHILVGKAFGVEGVYDDGTAAERAGWRFIGAHDFARGER